ncbi:MAG: diguanylate cyclase [Gammaproteobacteria bacterium]
MGDDALKKVATLLKTHVRAADRIYRYGGEELLVVLPHTNTIQAQVVAKKLVSITAKENIPHEKSRYGCLTISCGTACSLKNDQVLDRWESVVEQADLNLYQSKQEGRNRAVADQQDTASSRLSPVAATR